MADTVIVSKEFLAKVNHIVVTNNATITVNTTNRSLKNARFVASINVPSLDDLFPIDVKALTSPFSIICWEIKLITAKQLKATWLKI